MKNSLLAFFALAACNCLAQPYIKIDNNSVLADQSSNGISLPAWLNAGQTLAADANVYSISVLEFSVNGTQMDFSQSLSITTVQTVPAGKVWKIESVFFQNPNGAGTAWNLAGNGGTNPPTNFIGTTDPKDVVIKANNNEIVRVTSSGNVGIGTAAPTTKLEVNGQIKITGGSPGDGKILTSDASGTASWQSGAILQVVYSEVTIPVPGTGLIPYDNTIPQITEGFEFITATITPKSASSYLLVEVNTTMSESTNTSDWLIGAVFRDANPNAIVAGFTDMAWQLSVGAANNYSESPMVLKKRVASGSTAPTTFRFRAGGNAGPVEINRFGGTQYLGGSIITTMTVTEIGN